MTSEVEVEWPGRRADVIEALKALADIDHHMRWRSDAYAMTTFDDAVHWLLDDTGFDRWSALEFIPTMFTSEIEAAAIDEAVRALLALLDKVDSDRIEEFLDDELWPEVVRSSQAALAALRA